MKKKGQAVEAGVALSDLEKTKVLMASNEDNTSQGKAEYLIQVVRFMYVPKKSYSTPWLQKRKELPRSWMARLARSSALGQSRLQKEMGQCVL